MGLLQLGLLGALALRLLRVMRSRLGRLLASEFCGIGHCSGSQQQLHPPLTATARPKREAEPRAVLKIEVAEVSDMVVYKRIITIIRYMYSALEDVDATRALVARSKGEAIDTIFVCHKQASSSCD